MHQKVLIEVDALLDTRRGVMFGLDIEAGKALLTPAYYDRPFDNFTSFQSIVSHEQYKEAYAKRSVADLKNSKVTYMHFFLGELVRKLEENHRFNRDSAETVEVIVNTYPYVLSEEEQHVLAIAVGARLGVITPVTTTYIPLDKLDIRYINSQEYTAVVLYNFNEWAKLNLEKLEDKPDNAPGVTLFVPALFDADQPLPKHEDLVDDKGNEMDPFALMASFFAEVIGISFLPVNFYSPPQPSEIRA